MDWYFLFGLPDSLSTPPPCSLTPVLTFSSGLPGGFDHGDPQRDQRRDESEYWGQGVPSYSGSFPEGSFGMAAFFD